MPGIWQSIRTRSYFLFSNAATASSPFITASAARPSLSSSRSVMRLLISLSSASKIRYFRLTTGELFGLALPVEGLVCCLGPELPVALGGVAEVRRAAGADGAVVAGRATGGDGAEAGGRCCCGASALSFAAAAPKRTVNQKLLPRWGSLSTPIS